MDFITKLLIEKEKYPTVITDEVINFCRNILGDNEFNYTIEDIKIEKFGDSYLINAKTNVSSISLSIKPNAKNLDSPFSLKIQDLNRGILNYDIRNFNNQKLVSAFASIQNESGYHRIWTQGYGSSYLGHTFCTNENVELLKQVYGNDWQYHMRAQEEIPYDREDFEIVDSKQQIDIIKNFYLHSDTTIQELKSSQNRKQTT